jgi:hypothetical protein
MGIITKLPINSEPPKRINHYAIAFAVMSFIILAINISTAIENKKLRQPKFCRTYVKSTTTGLVTLTDSLGNHVAWFYDSIGSIGVRNCPDTILIYNSKDTFNISDFREFIK